MADAVARRVYDPGTRAQIARGQDQVSRFMAEHGVGFPEAVEALGRAKAAEFAKLRADYAERHGLDDDQTMAALYRHCIAGTGSIQ